MSTVLNDRDAILQAAGTRIVNPKNADIMLDMSAPAFHVNAAGVADVASITITGMLVGLEGPLSWSVQGATLSDVTDRSATVTYASMQGATAIITASMMSSGELFSRSRVLATMQDGLSGANAKTVKLTPSEQVFKISKAGANSPASITLTAVGQNTAGVPSFTIPVGTATLSAGSSSSQKVLTFANMTTDQVTVEVTLDGQKDRITVYKVREGQDGQPGVDAIVGLLTNESVTLPAGSNGVVSSFSNAVCTMVMYKGATDDSANWSYAFSPASASSRLSYTTSGSTVTLTGMAAGVDSSYVDITASKAGAASVTKRFFVTKSKAGASITGARGAGQYYVVGSAWSDVVAQAACPGGPVVNDQVTISNGTVTYTKRWDGAAWNVPGAYLSGGLFVEGDINGSKLKAGTVDIRKSDGTLLLGAGGEFGAIVKAANLETGAVQARHLAVSANPDNILPDPRFKDMDWWGMTGSPYSVGDWSDRDTAWRDSASLYLGVEAETVKMSNWFTVQKGARYRLEIQTGPSPTFAGQLSIFLLFENAIFHSIGQPSKYNWPAYGLPCQYDSNSPKQLQSFSEDYIVPPSATGRCRAVVIKKIDAGAFEFGSIRITRMSDSTLIGPGSVQTKHLAIADGGDISSGMWGFNQGRGFWIEGAGNGHGARMALGDAMGPRMVVDPNNGVFDFIGPKIQAPVIVTPFSISVPDIDSRSNPTNQAVSAGTTFYPSSGTGPYQCTWTFSSNSGNFLSMTSSPGDPNVRIQSLSGTGWRYGYLSVTVKDLGTGATATATANVKFQMGSGVEP